MRAAEDGYLKIVQALVENGAKLDAANAKGQTALSLAAKAQHKPVVDYLTEHSPKPPATAPATAPATR
jgi:ankyrin repeat protein